MVKISRGLTGYRRRFRAAPAVVVLILAAWPLPAVSQGDLEQARRLYQLTDYEGSLKVLQAMETKDAPVYELMGQDHYMQGEYKKATDLLDKALAADPANSDYELWLGRAFGRRAETASPLTAAPHAHKARQHFEKAVQLNPRNKEALSDLFEYYLQAPGFMGGGLNKASDIANQMAAIDPVEGQRAQARLAEKKKEFGSAEEHLQRAAELAPRQAGRLIDLAKFLARHGRLAESDQSFRKAEKIAPNSPQVIYARADTYIQQGRNLEVARKLLERYLQAQLSPDDPSRAAAEKLLKKASGG